MGDEEYYAETAADRETLMEIARRASESGGYTDDPKRSCPKSDERLNYDPVPPEVILDIADYFRTNDWMGRLEPLYVCRCSNSRNDFYKDSYFVFTEDVFWDRDEIRHGHYEDEAHYAAYLWDQAERELCDDISESSTSLYDTIARINERHFVDAGNKDLLDRNGDILLLNCSRQTSLTEIPLSRGIGATLTDAHEAYLRAAGEIPIFDSMPSCVPGKEVLLEYDFRARILPTDPTKCRVYIGNALVGNSEIDDKIACAGYIGTYFDMDGTLIKASERKSMLRFLDSSIGWQESQQDLGKATFTDQDFEEYERILREVAPKLPGFREKAFSIDPDSIRGTRLRQPDQTISIKQLKELDSNLPETDIMTHRRGR